MIFPPRGTSVVVDQLVPNPQRRIRELGHVAAVALSVVVSFAAVGQKDFRVPIFILKRDFLPMEPVATDQQFQEGTSAGGVRIIIAAMPHSQSTKPQRTVAPRR